MEKLIGLFMKIYDKVSYLGIDNTLSVYAKKRILVFNRLNAFGLLLAVFWFAYNASMYNQTDLTVNFLNILPCFIAIESFILMGLKKHKAAIYTNLIFTPLVLSIASIQMHEGTILLYLIVYSIFPFFNNRKFSRILIQFLYVITLYFISLYFLQIRDLSNPFVFSPIFQVIGVLFLFVTLYSIKVQVMLYEKLLRESKVQLDIKNRELNEMLLLKDKVFTVISHDIIVPLVGLKHMSENLMSEVIDQDEKREMFQLMGDEISKTHNLFNNLLDWSKAQLNGKGNKVSNTSIYEIVETVIDQVSSQATSKNIRITNNIDKDCKANVNAENILVTVRNLLVNAIKFTPPGGIVSLSCSKIENDIHIYVMDTGIGIDKEKMSKIFSSEFYTSQGTNAESGNGFGLKICMELIKQNGGSVYCKSSHVGEGSTFAIQLPIGKNINEQSFQKKQFALN
jgi:signal transduction histidine kinase